ncbi:MAG: HEPN domain-containing protein [Sulfolobales archaeon]
MSGEYAILLRRRALSMLRLAERLVGEAEYDLAVLNAEYAAQLYVRSFLLRLAGEEWRGS